MQLLISSYNYVPVVNEFILMSVTETNLVIFAEHCHIYVKFLEIGRP